MRISIVTVVRPTSCSGLADVDVVEAHDGQVLGNPQLTRRGRFHHLHRDFVVERVLFHRFST
jgi:phosphatidate phosphatase PAH1